MRDKLINRALWPLLPDLNPRDIYVWMMLKDEVYGSNPCPEQDLGGGDLEGIVSSFSPEELKNAKSIFL